MRLLLVEDDRMFGEALQQNLRLDGFTVDWVQTAEDAEVALSTAEYAVMLLDLGLPAKSGFDLLSEIRAQNNPQPIIVITARDARRDRIRGLDYGADDYQVKPFDSDELAARIRAVARRSVGRFSSLLAHGPVTMRHDTHEVTCHGKPVTLTAKEFAILAALMEKPGAILSQASLEDRLYGWGDEVASNAVEVHIHNLRKKLGKEFIRTVRGIGYKIGDNL
ncbi:response regulator [Geomesophilobacter sediminis]|uniref:Winged helix-turn-helix domain-containing protein n=1 Tax=Geomesophilobacter sediminis TaxID=2798584 RepID=A0A8J7LVQ6_9BACT|nr:response regulator [Geomesophilobacter sediminis]MBJ6725789.1 winged helix-turn-helix domain-containing protein [Geomesophilobacter sediminis]